MPRLPRKNVGTKDVHVIVQGINQEFIFNSSEQKQAYKYLLKKNLANTEVVVLAYCIMGNHAHILMHSNNINDISKIMHNTNTGFAKLYNKMNKRKGYVFRDRYNSQMILSANHLYNCIVYIHNNPVKANITNKPEDYEFSSYNEFIKEKDLLTKKSIGIIFGKNEDYLNIFYKIHERKNIEDVIEVIEGYKNYNEILDKFILKNNMDINKIIRNEKLFAELLLELRHVGDLSLRDMAKVFNINKDKLNKIININL